MTDDIQCTNDVHVARTMVITACVPSEGTCDCGQVRVEYDGCELRFRAPEGVPDPSQAPMEYYFDWNPSAWPTPDRNYP